MINVDYTIEGTGTIGGGDGDLTFENFGTVNANNGLLIVDTGNQVANNGLMEARPIRWRRPRHAADRRQRRQCRDGPG